MRKKKSKNQNIIEESTNQIVENSNINLSVDKNEDLESDNKIENNKANKSKNTKKNKKENDKPKEKIDSDKENSDFVGNIEKKAEKVVTDLKKETKKIKDKIGSKQENAAKELSAKQLAKIKLKESRKQEKIHQKEIAKKIVETNKNEKKKKLINDNAEKQKERDALKAQKKAVKLARKRQSATQYAERFDVDVEDGLSDQQVNQRILEGYSNFKPKSSSKTIPQIFIQNIFTFFNILTITIAGFLISVAAFKDLIFLLIITANIVIGIIQEIRAKKTIDQLSLISAPVVDVIRNGKIQEISVGEAVLDDIMILKSGKQICTDSIVVDGTIEVNESMLTGESDSIVKKVGDKLFSGSFVVSGTCKAKVDRVGKDNYIETLTSSAKKYMRPRSELLKSLNIIIYVMAVIIIPIGIALFYIQYNLNDMSYTEAIRKTAGAMIGMIPSGLYLVTSMALAVGVMRLAKKNVLVQELYCIEMLARINVLCLDKTGTITDGSMSVKDVVEYKAFGGLNTKYVVSAMLNALNDKNLTSKALETKFGLAKRLKSLALIPFSSKRKYSAVSFENYGTYVLGAPEFVLKEKYSTIEKDVDKFAKEGYRVLLLAYTDGLIVDGVLPETSVESMSLILIEDNIRSDAIDTIKYFKESGVEVKVISGDNPITVGKIAERAGVAGSENWISLDGMSEADVVRAATKYTVFGRVSPSQKRLLVRTLKKNKMTVAMTGDGVNDILALKEADCSIAMASGSEAARNVSHLVLMDSNFGSMPSVVAEGRRVINNITKVARLYLTKTMFSLFLAILALIEGYYPISTNQLFMIDMFCIGLPSIILVLEKNNDLNKGHFLSNVLKAALPGAIVILIESTIVYLLQDTFSMTETVSSTLIVMTATFACMMVLYDVCKKPFNSLHKVLFYTMFAAFIFIALLTPKFFDFAPLSDVGTYYSDDLEVYNYSTQVITISEDNKYVIDGYVITKTSASSDEDPYYSCSKNTTTHTISVSDDGILLDDTTLISTEDFSPEILDLYETNDGYYGLDGYVTDLEYDSYDTISVESDTGEIYFGSDDTGYNVMPEVTINDSGYYVLDSEYISEVKASSSTVGTITMDSDFNVYVDDVEIYSLYSSGFIYGFDSSNDLVLDMNETDLDFSTFDAEVTISGSTYCIDGVDSGVAYAPEITTTDAGYYIVNNYITDYEWDGDQIITQSITSDGYLIINGTTTNILVNYWITYGGNVETLPTNCLILLFMLCLLTSPLMKIVKNFVPFIKKWIRVIIDRLNRL